MSACTVDEIVDALHAVRRTLVAAIAPTSDPLQPRVLARELDVNRGLAWRVSRAIAQPSPSAMLQALPRPKSLAILLQACAARGVPSPAIEAASQAIDGLEDLLERIGEPRRSVPSLIIAAGLDGPGGPHFSTARQRLFEGARILWGVEAAVGVRLLVVWPGAPGTLDAALVRATVDLTSLRHGSWPVSYARTVTERNEVKPLTERSLEQRPIDEDGAEDLPFIRRFCSPQDLTVTCDEARGMLRYLVTPPGVGSANRVTCVLGTVTPNLFDEGAAGADPRSHMMMILETPLHRCQFDLLVRDDVEFATAPRVILCDRLTRPHGFEFAKLESERLPLEGELEEMGTVPAALATPDMPWYPDLVQHVLDRLDMAPERFRALRWELRHPPISTAAMLQFQAARRPAGPPQQGSDHRRQAPAGRVRSGTRRP